MDDKAKIRELESKLQMVTDELVQTKVHLKKYTAPAYKKEY